jgi:two-component system chemotaxis response regulator CheB
VSAKASIRVAIVDDSSFGARLRRALERDGDIEVVHLNGSARAVLAALEEVAPDVLAIDIGLPGLGLGAVEEIMSTAPRPIVVLTASAGSAEDAAAVLAAGALDTIVRDQLDLSSPDSPTAVALRRRMKVFARARVIRHPRDKLRGNGKSAAPLRPITSSNNATYVAIAASTGGPRALLSLLGSLPTAFEIPILVVQHMSPGFVGRLAEWLDTAVSLPVRVAENGDVPGCGVWIAPEDAHLVLRPGGTLGLDRATPGTPHRPAADVLFRSVASTAGAGAVAIVLTGMGSDGAAGSAAVRAGGGVTIAQDEASSAIYGMPRAAAEQGAEHVLALEDIGPALLALPRRALPRRAA